MWLIVGLGNPGSDYAQTRHNVGFMVVNALNSELSIPLWAKMKHYFINKGSLRGHNVVLMKPLTYMNRSGIAVQSFLSYYKEKRQIVVIYDDLDLDVGTVRIRSSGSPGGHKGVKSISEALGSDDFIRIRIGIGRPLHLAVSDYVLRPFNEDQRIIIAHSLTKAKEAVVAIIDKGISFAQNKYNKKEVLHNEQSTNDSSGT
jgi:PTH1 family peptidyl-tRNA hydrolase